MFERFDHWDPLPARALDPRPAAVGLVRTDHDTWIVVAPLPGMILDEIDMPERSEPRPMCICHEVLADGRVRIGKVDPERVSILSDVLGNG